MSILSNAFDSALVFMTSSWSAVWLSRKSFAQSGLTSGAASAASGFAFTMATGKPHMATGRCLVASSYVAKNTHGCVDLPPLRTSSMWPLRSVSKLAWSIDDTRTPLFGSHITLWPSTMVIFCLFSAPTWYVGTHSTLAGYGPRAFGSARSTALSPSMITNKNCT